MRFETFEVSVTRSLIMDFTVKETICMFCIFWNVWWGIGKRCHFKVFNVVFILVSAKNMSDANLSTYIYTSMHVILCLHRLGCSSIVSWCSWPSAAQWQFTLSLSFLRPRTKPSLKSRTSSDPPKKAVRPRLMESGQHCYQLLYKI